jgi:hypothetical protein
MGYPTPPLPIATYPELPAARARRPHSRPMIGPRSPFPAPHFTAGAYHSTMGAHISHGSLPRRVCPMLVACTAISGIGAHRQPAAVGGYGRTGAEDVEISSEGCLHCARALPAVHARNSSGAPPAHGSRAMVSAAQGGGSVPEHGRKGCGDILRSLLSLWGRCWLHCRLDSTYVRAPAAAGRL